MDEGKRKEERSTTPRVDVLETLLKVYTVEQLEQFARLSIRAAQEEWMPDVVVRFKNGHPRWIGKLDWEEMEKPKNG